MNKNIKLRRTTLNDLPLLFKFQLDDEANYLAAFTPKDFTDKAAYLSKYSRLLNDTNVNNQTICINDMIVGSIARFEMNGDNEITYWIDREYWGKGIATAALKIFLLIEKNRPLLGRVAFDNIGSQRVLEKCGFTKVGSDKGFANARQVEVEEFIYKLSH